MKYHEPGEATLSEESEESQKESEEHDRRAWLAPQFDEPKKPKGKKGPKDPMLEEYKEYLKYVWEPDRTERRFSVEQWWLKYKSRWPNVAGIARRRLATQATSAASERSFSKAGLIVSRKRMMLTPQHVDGLSLLGWHCMQRHEHLMEMRAKKRQKTSDRS